MQEAVPIGQGAIAAILGLSDDAARALCAQAAEGEVLEPVNYNSPGRSSSRGPPAPSGARSSGRKAPGRSARFCSR